jgi:hypothetical protein
MEFYSRLDWHLVGHWWGRSALSWPHGRSLVRQANHPGRWHKLADNPAFHVTTSCNSCHIRMPPSGKLSLSLPPPAPINAPEVRATLKETA